MYTGVNKLPQRSINQHGEEEYAAMKRSTNGGGENSPVLEGQDDYYEMLMMEMEMDVRGNL